MNENISGDSLAAITIFLLDPESNIGAIFKKVQHLHEYFSSVTGIRAGQRSEDKDIYVPGGKALGPGGAAHCLLEGSRTAIFLRGIHKALHDLRKLFPGERLHILYAGCGPYATLLTPLTSVFSPKEIAIHLMDINPVSLNAAKRLYDTMGLNAYVEDIILDDAATYKVPQGKKFHLMVSETMQQALRDEPQVAIMQNLMPQLTENGVFIPQDITISAQLLSGKEELSYMSEIGYIPERIVLGDVYKISQQVVSGQQSVTLSIPGEVNSHTMLYLMTDIHVYADQHLTAYQCSLNLPVYVADIKKHTGNHVSFSYSTNDRPGFVHEFN